MLTRELFGCNLTGLLTGRTFWLVPSPKKRVKVQRLEIQLPPSLLAWLRLEAKRRDVSLAEVIRVALYKLVDQP